MSLRSHFIHSCVVERRTATGDIDAHGNPVYEWTGSAAVDCRLVSCQMRDARGVTADVTAAGQYRLLLPEGTAVAVGDRVRVTADGAELPQRFVVTKVLPRRAFTQHHVSAWLEAVG